MNVVALASIPTRGDALGRSRGEGPHGIVDVIGYGIETGHLKHRQGKFGGLLLRFHGLSSRRATRALADLCEIFNHERVCYPETDLRLRFEAPECHTN
jgi:hypothetical protein